MASAGYFRYPTCHAEKVVFVADDDLWTVPITGGVAHRLTANLGEVTRPCFSPDGQWLAYTGKEEGPTEIFVMPSSGGPGQRVTYLGGQSWPCGWTQDGSQIVLISNAGQPFAGQYLPWRVSPSGGLPEPVPTGPATHLSHGPNPGIVISRFGVDPARWKRYRGGQAGVLWIDPDGQGEFRPLIQLPGNLSRPLWLGARIYFVSDHEGIGNLYSCTPEGTHLQRHTDHAEFYVRNPSSDGRRIVYHSAGELYVFDPATDMTQPIRVEFHSPRVQGNRKFVPAARYLEEYVVHPAGHSLAVCSRGQLFTCGHWEGPVLQLGQRTGVRYRLPRWLPDGQRLLVVSDEGGEEALEIHAATGDKVLRRFSDLDLGRPILLEVSPTRDLAALTNHRFELWLIDLNAGTARQLDASQYDRLAGIDWSADGRWLAYSFPQSPHTAALKICRVETGETQTVTRPVLLDVRPSFDPEGKYLYFLSYREFYPVYDQLHFDLSFPSGVRPYLLTLRKDVPSPFVPTPRAPGEKRKDEEPKDRDKTDRDKTEREKKEKPASETPAEEPADKKSSEPPALEIDFEGIADRVIALPVPVARYDSVAGLPGKVLFSSQPVEGKLVTNVSAEPASNAILECFEYETLEKKTLINNLSSYQLSLDRKTLVYRAGNRLRAAKAGEKIEDNRTENAGRKHGWIDLRRIKLAVLPSAERQQMYREAWRLQRDHFWSQDMSQVDWEHVYQRYLPLVERIATRGEFSDLLWEVHGELGTSHAYESGGDYRLEPRYDQGFLGADFAWDEVAGGYRLTQFATGDLWEEGRGSPLLRPGLNLKQGDVLLAISGQSVRRDRPPGALLVHLAGEEVALTFRSETANGTSGTRTLNVKTLRDERPLRYRDWVEKNRRWVHEQTQGRVGYVHVPDMGPRGYAEFHRYYLAEIDREGLIVDARFNTGGHVSALLLEKLGRKRLGSCRPRWGQPNPYPTDSVAGPLVALTNESAGSDGDIFSHCFRLMKLGPLIGKRTWGGVIGIWVRHWLVDGSVTTQPEYSFWFGDVGWGLENRGAEPDQEVELRPQDFVAGRDPQLAAGVQAVVASLESGVRFAPEFAPPPSRRLPELPPRNL